MTRSFALSFAALDILSEQFQLSRSPFPFEIPGHGHTHDERAGIRRAVFADLERRGLAHRGRVEPEVEEALAMLARPQVAITAFGDHGGGRKLFARLGSTGGTAVIAVQQQLSLTFEYIRHTAMVSTAVSLLPDHRAGVGQSVTIELSAPPPEPTDGRIASVVRPTRTGRTAQVRAVETMLSQPKIRFGQFRVIARDRHGKTHNAPDLFWFDTVEGRFLMLTTAHADGSKWSTYSPADKPRIGQHLGTQLNSLAQ